MKKTESQKRREAELSAKMNAIQSPLELIDFIQGEQARIVGDMNASLDKIKKILREPWEGEPQNAISKQDK
ncbi:MAG: hypothetical protein LBO03_04315 [Acidaminococcales bacterium]|jgi:hypothetical protein|nr:hypothetical protein [Acidaminococcales bacterium]